MFSFPYYSQFIVYWQEKIDNLIYPLQIHADKNKPAIVFQQESDCRLITISKFFENARTPFHYGSIGFQTYVLALSEKLDFKD